MVLGSKTWVGVKEEEREREEEEEEEGGSEGEHRAAESSVGRAVPLERE